MLETLKNMNMENGITRHEAKVIGDFIEEVGKLKNLLMYELTNNNELTQEIKNPKSNKWVKL